MKRLLMLTVVFTCLIGQAWAQNKDGKVSLPDSLEFSEVIRKGVKISGNDLTKDRIIIRELDFKIPDTLEVKRNTKVAGEKMKRSSVANSSELFLHLKYSRGNIINTKQPWLDTLVNHMLLLSVIGYPGLEIDKKPG